VIKTIIQIIHNRKTYHKMFYYREKLPAKDTIVVADLLDEKDNNNCLYVTLPEFNNYRGIIYKCELPKRLKMQKKTISEMKHAKQIVCIVSNKPKVTSDGQPELIDLSVKGIDQKWHADIITRFINVEKILKLVKFISIQFKYDFSALMENLYQDTIIPLTNADNIDGIDNFTELYSKYLRDYKQFIELLSIPEEESKPVVETFKNILHETNTTSSLKFDLFVWKGDKNGKDALFVIRDMFEYVKAFFTKNLLDKCSLEIRYIGAPTYQINLSNVERKTIDTIYNEVRDTIQKFMQMKGVNEYDLKFDIEKKEVKNGDITISFPFHFEID
jgi:translation initiation factor 2 alpha subunit (eIF-2alpha)